MTYMVLNLLHEVEQVCDSVTIISKGRLIAQGEVSQLIATAGSEQIRIRTTDDSKAFRLLSVLGWLEDIAMNEDSLLITAPIERSAELTAALANAEVYVAEMVPVRKSLEEYFLEVTARENEGLQ